MTIASVILQAAYRENNLIPIGSNPTTAQTTEALAKLNRIIDGLFGNEAGEKLFEWPLPPPQRSAPVAAQWPLAPAAHDLPSNVWPYPPGNVRLMSTVAVATTLYFQNLPNDGARVDLVDLGMSAALTINANGRLIESAAGVAVATLSFSSAAGGKRWFYRSDIGTWVIVTTLISTDSLPFPKEFDDYFISELNIRICPAFGKTVKDSTAETRNRGLSKLKARYRQPTAVLNNSADAPSTLRTGYGDCGWMT